MRRTLLFALALGLIVTGLSGALLPADYASRVEVRFVPRWAGGMGMPLYAATYAAILKGKAADAARISRVPVTSADLLNQSDIACERRIRSLQEVLWEYWRAWKSAAIGRLLQPPCYGVGMDAVLLITVNDRDPGRAMALSQAWLDVLSRMRSRENVSLSPADRIYVQARSMSIRNVSLERAVIIGGLGALLGFLAATARRRRADAQAVGAQGSSAV